MFLNPNFKTFSNIQMLYSLDSITNVSESKFKTFSNIQMLYSLVCDEINILTYRNNPSYISMVIFIFLSVRSNTDQILMK